MLCWQLARPFPCLFGKLTLGARVTLNCSKQARSVECHLHSISFTRRETLKDTDYVGKTLRGPPRAWCSPAQSEHYTHLL